MPESRNSLIHGRTRLLAEAALCVALCVVLSHVRLFRMPQGGSVTLESAPILIFALRRGVRYAALAGCVAGVMQLFLGGYIVHPLQALLDYPMALASLAVAGFARIECAGQKQKTTPLLRGIVAITCAGLARLFCHTLSGVVFFASYAPEGVPVWEYSIIYNASFLLPSMLISGIVAWFVARRLEKTG